MRPVDLVDHHHREHFAGVEAHPRGLGVGLDLRQRVDEGDLTSFELVPRMVGVRVVAAEHDPDHLVGIDGL